MAKAKTVDVELGRRTRTLRLDLNALCALEEVDLEVSTLNAQLQGGKVKLTTIRKMVWAFLQTDSEDASENPSLKTVGGWISLDNMADIGKAVGQLLVGDVKTTDAAKADESTVNPTQAEQ